MRKVLFALAAVSAIAATPAFANEARVEARGGVIWDNGSSQDIWGAAAGYDFDLGSSAFAGVEVSGDKIGSSGTRVAWGFTGRLGAKVAAKTKLYVDGGYTTAPCTLCDDAVHAGVGVEQTLVNNVYGKLGYRHFFTNNGGTDLDTVAVGVGIKF